MIIEIKEKDKLLDMLNKALGWELRAHAMYAHYAAYVKGLESVPLGEHFEEEATESIGHAKQVRDIIAQLDGTAVTDRDSTAIVHTEDWKVMLEEALKTETTAAKTYKEIMPLVKEHPVFTHTLMHIYMDELKAVDEVNTLLGK
ncbi:MAG: hypothetical protein GF341_11525 [candidate division Zixibacteria bacterium]|nr:hypothetical protein [candidate division Zixibacteria bacterium]